MHYSPGKGEQSHSVSLMEDKGQFGGKFHDGEARTFLKTTVVYDTVIHRRDR